MASTENLSAPDGSDSPAATAQDNTTTTTTTTTAPEHSDVPAPSSSSPAAAEATQLAPNSTESQSKEKNDTEDFEDKSSPREAAASAAATPTPDDTTTANTTTTNVAAEPPTSGVEASEAPETTTVTEGEDAGPELVITLLLITGARHPFKIDKKYLRRRSVKVDNDDPFNMSVYTLKELIWREWRAEWEPQPSSPSSIRLISFGKLLDDKSPLSESSLTHDAPNVIHMTVKPQEVVDEEDAKGGKSYSARDRDASDRSPGCRCIIL